jgi:hypothetical protein
MAMRGRGLFNGSIPPRCLTQILNSVDFTDWQSVWVGCSGTFSFERAIGKQYPAKQYFGNDVSFLSAVIAAVALERPLDFQFTGQLAHFEELMKGRDFLDRAAAVILAMSIQANHPGKSDHSKHHWAHYLADLDASLERPKEKLIAMSRELPLTDYMPGDFRDHLARCAEAGGGFVVSAPFLKGFYENWFRFIHANVKWSEPTYRMWDPDDFPGLLDQLDDLKVPYIAVYKQPLEGRHTAAYYRSGMHPPFYVLSSRPPKATSVIDQPPVTSVSPFRFTALDLDRLGPTNKVRIAEIPAKNADYIKTLFLQENIRFTSGMLNFGVFIDDMLAGVLTMSRSNAHNGQYDMHDTVYLLSDVSTTRFGRVAKLLAMLALSDEVIGLARRRLSKRPIKAVITTVRSNNAVSMKYRGIYELLSRKQPDERDTSGSAFILNYAGIPLGLPAQEVFALWLKKHYKDDRERKVTNSYARQAS